MTWHLHTRRDFLSHAARGLPAMAVFTRPDGLAPEPAAPPPSGAWDLSWLDRLKSATDRAVFDWPSVSNPNEDIVPQIAARYLDNCAAAYQPGTYTAVAVFNARTRGIPVGMNDALWARYALGAEYGVKDPDTNQPALRNPFWGRPTGASAAPTISTPTLQEFVQRGAIILVCDFAMGHLATRLSAQAGRSADEVHQDLRAGLVSGAYAVPSGIFGLARAQNAGCAFIRM